MTRFALAARLSLGIVSLTIVLVLVSQQFGIIPDRSELQRVRRQAICEGLAMHCTLAAQRDDRTALAQIISIVAKRNPDIAQILVEPLHQAVLSPYHRDSPDDELQSGTITAKVPVLVDARPWGTVQVVFDSHNQDVLVAITEDPVLKLAAFLATIGLLTYFGYCLLLTRVFYSPSTPTMPSRVRDTLDNFSEGVLVLDHEHQIAFANQAFRSASGLASEEIEGRNAIELPWHDSGSAAAMPWEHTRDGGKQRTILSLNDLHDNRHSLSVRAVPILDEGGEFFGSLATFDDLTAIERLNARLRQVLDLLRKSRSKVREQNRELKRLATQDPLTMCLNRRALFERFRPLYNSALRYQQPLSCIMLDIDHFKSINDQHGHAKGDEVLAIIAATLRDASRGIDLVCRYGGEEFCLVLPHTELSFAREVALRYRQLVEELDFGTLSVTVSLGVSDFSFGASSEEQLIDQADQALYVAKHSGRNRVVTFEELLHTRDIAEAIV